MEIIDIVDRSGRPTGQTIDRETAHLEGIRHRTAHLWILRRRGAEAEVLLQQRSPEKDSHPGCYDISSAGHIPAGIDFIPSALRELREELGLTARAEELHYCGQRAFSYQGIFHDRPFWDRQVTNVYYMWRDVAPEDCTLQPEEVSAVKWLPFSLCMAMARRHDPACCIYPEELELIADAAGFSPESGRF